MRKIIPLIIMFALLQHMQSFATEHEIWSYIKIDETQEADTNNRLTPLFKLSFNQELNVREEIANSINKINENKIGQDLLERLCFLIKSIIELKIGGYDGFIHVTFNDGSGTSFIGKGYNKRSKSRFNPDFVQYMQVYLNIDFNNKGIVYNPKYGLGSLIPAIKPSLLYPNFFEIAHCFDPFWITVAHELIHMEHFLTEQLNKYTSKDLRQSINKTEIRKDADISADYANKIDLDLAKQKISKLNKFKIFHIDIFEQLPDLESLSTETLENYYKFLDNPLRFHARYSVNLTMSDWENLSKIISTFPELKAREREKKRKSLSFFANLEERETVIGSRCSELMIRLAENERGNVLPIRYLYQDMDTFFLEKISVILEIVNMARKELKELEWDEKDLINMLNHEKLPDFFNLGLFLHIVTEELMPDFTEEEIQNSSVNLDDAA